MLQEKIVSLKNKKCFQATLRKVNSYSIDEYSILEFYSKDYERLLDEVKSLFTTSYIFRENFLEIGYSQKFKEGSFCSIESLFDYFKTDKVVLELTQERLQQYELIIITIPDISSKSYMSELKSWFNSNFKEKIIVFVSKGQAPTILRKLNFWKIWGVPLEGLPILISNDSNRLSDDIKSQVLLNIKI